MSTNKRNKKHIKMLNNISYQVWFDLLYQIWLSRFVWENIDDTCDAEMIEKSLCKHGRVCIFADSKETPVLLSLPYASITRYDAYGYPIKVQPYSPYTSTYKMVGREFFEIGFNNLERTESYTLIDHYAMRLSNIQRQLDTNIQQQKATSGFAIESEQQKDAIITGLTNMTENIPFMIVDKKQFEKNASGEKRITMENFKCDVAYIGDKLRVELNATLNEFLNVIGIENSNMDKRERVNSQETNGNIGILEICRNKDLLTRQKLCDKVNKKWGRNWSVRFNSDVKTLLNSAFNSWDEEPAEENEVMEND